MNIAQLLTKLKALIYSKSETDSLLGGKANSSHTHTKSQITDFPSLSTVATSGSYSDLSNKPTIPSKTSQLTNDSGFITGVSWNNVSGKPSTFTPSSHTHTKSQITDFPSYGNTAGTICQGNDPRLSDARTPYFANGTWYAVGDDAAIGDHNVGGGLGVKALNSTTTRIDLCYKDDAANYKSITYDGTTLYMNGNCDYANSAGSASSVAWTNVSGRPTAVSKFTNDSGYITSSGSCSYSTTSGTSTYSTYLKSLGSQTPKSGRDIFHSGVYTYTTFTDTNTPAHYGAVIGYGNGQGGSCEMFAEWVGRGKLWFRVLRDCIDSWTDWQQIITSDNIGSQSVNYANSAGSVAWGNVSGRPTAVSQFSNDSEFWSPGGGKWNPNANISLPASGNGQEWSFDMHRNGTTGCYWHVWEDSLGTCLKVSADDGSVSIPRNILYLGGYKVYVG